MLDFSRLVAMLVVFEGGGGPKGQDGGLYYSFLHEGLLGVYSIIYAPYLFTTATRQIQMIGMPYACCMSPGKPDNQQIRVVEKWRGRTKDRGLNSAPGVDGRGKQPSGGSSTRFGENGLYYPLLTYSLLPTLWEYSKSQSLLCCIIRSLSTD